MSDQQQHNELQSGASAAEGRTLVERLRELSAKWRMESERHERHGDCYRKGQGWGLKDCADELDATLLREAAAALVLRPSPEPQEIAAVQIRDLLSDRDRWR